MIGSFGSNMEFLFHRISENICQILFELQIFFSHFYSKLIVQLNGIRPTKLHLGCGNIHLNGFENIDVMATPAVDRILDLRRTLPYQSNSVNLIVSEQVVEHFSPHELKTMFFENYRILKKNGILIFNIPNFEDLTKSILFENGKGSGDIYIKDLKNYQIQFDFENLEVKKAYYYNHLIHQYGEHKFFYNYSVLEMLLKNAGFHKIKQRNTRSKFESVGRFGHSLYVEAVK